MTAASRLGATIQGKYRLERVLGEGGMGVVYAARHVKLDRAVAVKVMHASFAANEPAVLRFFDEARAAGSLRHPNVIDVVDVDTDESGAPFMVMEMLEGESLAAFLARRGAVPAEEVVALLDPVLDGLAAAHARGIVHRDLKPDNVFLARVGTSVVPKLLDFGIAKLRDPRTPGTATGAIVGTPMYMAPEQAAGSKDIGPWVDVWAMGAVCFEAITGRSHLELPPDPNVMAILSALATQAPRRVAELAPSTPATVAAAIDAALVPDATRRLRSIDSFRAMLHGAPALAATLPHASNVPDASSSSSARGAPVLPSGGSLPPTRLGVAARDAPSRLLRVGAFALAASLLGLLAWAALRASQTAPRAVVPVSGASGEVASPASPVVVLHEITPPEMPPADLEPDVAPDVAPGTSSSPASRGAAGTSPRPRPSVEEPSRPTAASTRTGTWNPDDL